MVDIFSVSRCRFPREKVVGMSGVLFSAIGKKRLSSFSVGTRVLHS